MTIVILQLGDVKGRIINPPNLSAKPAHKTMFWHNLISFCKERKVTHVKWLVRGSEESLKSRKTEFKKIQLWTFEAGRKSIPASGNKCDKIRLKQGDFLTVISLEMQLTTFGVAKH